MKKEKIHAIVKYFYPVTAGIETNMLETYSVLANEWDVRIHTSRDTYLQKDHLAEREKIEGMGVNRYSFKWWGFWPNINWNEKMLICLHNFDMFPHILILVYSLTLKIFGKKNFKLVLTPHGGFSLDESWSLFPFWQRVIKRFYHNLFAPILINHSVDGVRAVSEWEKSEMVKSGINNDLIEVISNGIEDEAYFDVEKLAGQEIKNKVKSWGKYLIQVGRVYPIKNYETTIKALREVPEEVKFVIVGPVEKNKYPDYWQELKSLITELGLDDRVIFAGVIRGVDKFYAMKNAETMVHMAMWESFCNVVHEGMSQGLPVVVANNTALPFLVKDKINGYLVGTKDHKRVAEKINHILKNKNSEELRKISRTNIEFGKEHAWSKVAEKMDDFYKTLSRYG